MKKQFLILCSLLLVGCGKETTKESNVPPSTTEEDDKTAQVILMYGQSNMEGNSYKQYLVQTVGKDKTLEYTNGYDNVLISYETANTYSNSNHQFVPVKLGQGYSNDRFGPEVGMAEILSKQELKHPVYLIKFAYGATNLYSQWNPSTTGNLYQSAITYTLEQLGVIESLGYTPEVKAICWMQGEADSTTDYYQNYADNESGFITSLRQEFDSYASKEIGFIDAGISDSSAWTHYQEINKAKEQVAEESENNIYFSTIEEGLTYNKEPIPNIDYYHYDSDSMIKLGHLFSEKALGNFLE